MAVILAQDLNSASSLMTYSIADTTRTFPGIGTVFKRISGGDFNDGMQLTTPITGETNLAFQYDVQKTVSTAGAFQLNGIALSSGSFASYSVTMGATDEGSNKYQSIQGGSAGTTLVDPIVLGTWYTVKMLLKSDDSVELYFDGVLKDTATSTGMLTNPIYLGLNADYYNTPACGYRYLYALTNNTFSPLTNSSLSGIAVSGTEINLSWTPGTELAAPQVSVYQDGILVSSLTNTGFAQITSDIVPGTSYSFYIREEFVDFENNIYQSADSNTITISTPSANNNPHTGLKLMRQGLM